MIKTLSLSMLGVLVGLFFGYSVPRWIVAMDISFFPIKLGNLRIIGWIPILLGVSIFLWCYWLFSAIGRGTAWPFDPPKRLVVSGPYRVVRNPMEVSYLLALLGEMLLFESSGIGLYLIFNFLFLHFRGIFIEEPQLRERFGQQYEAYSRAVPRWIPGSKSHSGWV